MFAADDEVYISYKSEIGSFPLAVSGKPAPLLVSSEDFPGVIRATKDLQADIKRVTHSEPSLAYNKAPSSKEIIIVGTIGKSPLLDKLIKDKKLNINSIKGKWETFSIQVIEKPMKGVDRALVIAGSDKRGTIYGIYDLSAQIGVSPWYWWADVPVKEQKDLYVLPGNHSKGEPAVKYRGFFINDEAPAISGWTHEKFGGFNHQLYEKVFELLLRLKGNYIWPAMWGNAFYDDDPKNAEIAEEYGVVIGTSHHEPLARAHDEWRRYGEGPWNYNTNRENLQEFWREGIKRMEAVENIVTIGMRGDGDEPMAESTQISVLENIVKDQREIIKDVTGKDIEETPQIWALYKEVQDYYDKGMRVPDDVTLLLCDDNWGNIRKLPKPGEKQHTGGYGIYYHYDYVGGPRNYKWVNTNPIQRVWEQMHLAYQHNADKIWIVNVGDIKPMEYPLEFFLDYAWNPEKWPADKLDEYAELWAKKQFGPEHAPAIADFLTKYTKFNGRRKPELLSPETYSLHHYKEAETVVSEYNQLADDATNVYEQLAPEFKDAYYQLVLHPIEGCSNLNDLYFTVAKNHWYATQGRSSTNELAIKAEKLFKKDSAISHFYNKEMADGKWNHMMDQTHISYTYWQQPERDTMPEVKRIELKEKPEMGVALEGSDLWWPLANTPGELPEMTPFDQEKRYIEIFNRGSEPFNFTITADNSWVRFSKTEGNLKNEERIWVDIDWQNAPEGKSRVSINITAKDQKPVTVYALVDNRNNELHQFTGFVESDGYVSIEAENFTNKVESNGINWKVIPGLGKTLSGITTFPVTSETQMPQGNSPRLEYTILLKHTGNVNVQAFFSPTLDFHNNGIKYGISFDDEEPQIFDLQPDKSNQAWEKQVADNIQIITSNHKINDQGAHTLKFWMVDPAVVLQKIVVNTGGLKPSYLGPPQSFFKKADSNK